LVQGQLRTRKWQDQAGADRYTTEVVLQGFGANIVLLDSKGANGGGGDAPASGGAADGGCDGWAGADDEIPF
jgi:single-strand DNA-binding protein